MRKVIYCRESLFDNDEHTAAKDAGFIVVPCITEIPEESFVVPRYSMYPFVKDQYREIKNRNSKVINRIEQHRYIADLGNYIRDISDLSPLTHLLGENVSNIPFSGPFVLKGQTNSRKNSWKSSMYAETLEDLKRVHNDLLKDTLIGQQDIYARKFEKLKTYMIGISDMPVTKEFRCFIAYGQIISKGYYWSNYYDDIEGNKPDPSEIPEEFLQTVIDRIGKNSNFYCIDVAQKEDESWIVIELNCGMQSGLSMNDPEKFYTNLYNSIKE